MSSSHYGTDLPRLDGLELIFERQLELQTKSYGADPRDLIGEDRAEYIRSMVLALEDELHEALGEVGWKPWATSRHLNREAYLGELVDALHFFINLCMVADIRPAELFLGYMEKAARNAARQRQGYDGVAGKCPGCGRALDDPAVECRLRYSGVVWCATSQAFYTTDDGRRVYLETVGLPVAGVAKPCRGCGRDMTSTQVACTEDGCVLQVDEAPASARRGVVESERGTIR